MDRRARACRLAVAAALTLCAFCYAATPPPAAPPGSARPATPAPRNPATPAPTGNAASAYVRPPATAPTTHPAEDAIPPQTLQAMYRLELGNRYNPADAARYEAVHQLIEQYFDATTG